MRHGPQTAKQFFETLGAVLRTLGVRLGFLEPTVFVKTTQTPKHTTTLQSHKSTVKNTKTQIPQRKLLHLYKHNATRQTQHSKIQNYELQTPQNYKHQNHKNTNKNTVTHTFFQKGGELI